MPTHCPAFSCAVDHLSAVSSWRADWRQIKDWLVTMAEEENKPSCLIRRSSAGGRDLIELTLQRKRLRGLDLKLGSWLLPKHIQGVLTLSRKGDSL